MIVYVATVDTYWGIVAVADDEQAARSHAAMLALKYLEHSGATTEDTDTVAKVLEYFEPRVTQVELNGAAFEGNEKVLP